MKIELDDNMTTVLVCLILAVAYTLMNWAMAW
jgi:hypothetical protein